ncbi:MAG TPA: hypothetical protein VH392_03400 [Sphingomicrobium sp.]
MGIEHHLDLKSLNQASTAHPRTQNGLFARLFESMGVFCCGLQGHDMLMRFEEKRVFLQCASCGHESPGWSVAETRPKTALRGNAQHHVLTRPQPQLIPTRRVA